ncbi:hypothetical protein ACLKMH_01065 [Psychromonas sp. KJ10-10]|uniref:hypothetical protein n=1 Tax=Psychromonas sp. KJ10-10 TaxID=3391823 RepID=UPI0039B4E4E5
MSTYELGDLDVDNSISVRVNYTDGVRNLEILTSSETATISNINDVPTATNLNQTVPYIEGDSSVELGNIVITDVDTTETLSATLTIANTAVGSLTTGTFGSTTSSYDSNTGVWSVTGSLSDVNAALASVAFVPTTNNDINTSITTHIEDASGTGPSDGLISLNVSAENDVPSATNLTQVQSYTEGASSVALDDIVISDVDTGETITTTLTLENTATGGLTTGTFGATSSSYNSGTGVWSVTGSVSDVNARFSFRCVCANH